MDAPEIVADMCSEDLSLTDIKAICKARGFSLSEAKNRKFLENFILSDQGVAEAMEMLTQKEIILLHALTQASQPVDITFFERIYGPAHRESSWGITFTKRYKEVFKKVRESLIRRGLLLFTEDIKKWTKTTKLERLVFLFPSEFQKFLPSPFEPIRDLSGPGNSNRSVLRKKLLEISGGTTELPVVDRERFRLHVNGGELCMGKKAFRARYLYDWQKVGWANALAKKKTKKFSAEQFCLIDAVSYALSLLGPDEWSAERQLGPVLNIFCHGLHLDEVEQDPHKICHAGWMWGCLSKNVANDQTCYRMAGDYSETGRDLPFPSYLQPSREKGLIVDLETIPYRDLESLGRISDFKVIGPQLTAVPNIVRLGRVFSSVCKEPLVTWLRDKVPSFGDAVEKVGARWGRQIIHQDLLVAKVGDLGLKVAIERSFPNPTKLLFLPNGFIAFPRGLLGEIEKLVTKSGFVVRSIS